MPTAHGQRDVALPLQYRALPITSADEKARTVELVWTTGARVRRYDYWDGAYDEELVVSEEACDLTRLNNSAPLLDTHGRWQLDDQIGVVERAWIDGAEGRAVVRFPAEGIDADADRIFAKV